MIKVDWNYETLEYSKKKPDPIIITQITKDAQGTVAEMIDLTLDEAEFLIVELRRMIDEVRA